MVTLLGEYLELRTLPEQHLPALLKVYQGTPLYFDGLGYDVQRLTLADVQAQWQAAQKSAGRNLLGVYHRVTDLLIGCVDVQFDAPQPQEATILLLLIWGGFQRQGYGLECMALLVDWFIQRSMTELWAIASNNEEGISFLEQQGFVVTEQTAIPPIATGQAFLMRHQS
jgi:ribosomal protein S18 acetylase RimI-like enzyme